MTINEVLSNIFSQLDKYQMVLFESTTTHEYITTTYITVMDFFKNEIRLRFEDDNFNIINTYFLRTSYDAEEKLIWILNMNDLKINSIAYFLKNEYQDTVIDAFSTDEILTYSFLTERDKDTIHFSYQTHIEDVDVKELIGDYKYFIDVLHKEIPKRKVNVLQDPIQDFRKRKLMEIGFD